MLKKGGEEIKGSKEGGRGFSMADFACVVQKHNSQCNSAYFVFMQDFIV